MRVAAAGCDHLQALRLGNAAIGIEDAAARARHVEEPFQRCLTGIAAGGDKDKDLARFAMLFAAHGEQIRQQLERHVLERQRRAMPKLQTPRADPHLFHRRNALRIKARAVRAGNRTFKLLRRKIRQEAGKHKRRPLLVIHGNERRNFLRRKCRELRRHVKPTVRRKAAQNRHGRRNRSRTACRFHLHNKPLQRPAAALEHSREYIKDYTRKRKKAASAGSAAGSGKETKIRSDTCGCLPARSQHRRCN